MAVKTGKYYTMFLALLTMITALSISAVAIYYSVAGLVAIFAAAAVPIMIMGGTLEIAKLVTAVWLHKYWSIATWWLRSYLAISVVVLMFITSMGIFGFLSKAHIEQTSAGEESVAQVERLTTEIARQQAIIVRAEEQIKKLETTGTGNDSQIQAQIDKEQERIDTAYERINPAIAEQNAIIAGVTALFQNELDKIDADIATLQGYIDAGDIKKAQGMIGAKADGAYGPKTAAAFTAWTDAKKLERNQWLQKIQDAGTSATVVAARNEIARLRANADTQIAESNKLINRLRSQLGATDKTADIDAQVDEQSQRIKTANAEIDSLTEEKYTLEGEYRKLEAEVGPIKYIAEFVYGEQADKNMLEKAVTWVIVIIIFVFDPLAVLLLIASQYTFEYHQKRREEDDEDEEQKMYEQARAERMVQNVPPDFRNTESSDASTDANMGELLPEQDMAAEFQGHSSLEQPEVHADGLTPEEIAQPYIDTEPEEEPQKKSIESSDELRLTEEQLDELDQHPAWQDAKQRWKDDNPDATLKEYKLKYLHGIINKLPWEDYLKEPQSPDPNEDTGYIQNQEQNENSIWKRIGDK